jgi:hypothetical protein
VIADSCFIIDLIRESPSALKKLKEIQEARQLQLITAPTVMELAVGVELAALPEDEQRRVDEILAGFQILPPDSTAAWRAGMEIGRLRRSGVVIDPIDAQIAGIALQHDETVVTCNTKHFQSIRGLEFQSY